MKRLFSLLNSRERRTVRTAAAIAGIVCAALLIFALRAQVRSSRAEERLAAAEARNRDAGRNRDAARNELNRWAAAEADLRELGASWFYDPAKGIPGLRSDLGQVLETAGIIAPEIDYNALDLVKNRLHRVLAEFRFRGSYLMLRRLLETVENHPRALHVDKIEFEDIGTEPGLVQVRVGVAGYLLHAK
jgi:hypothetical protein